MTPAEFRHIAPTLPREPGIYKYFSADNELIYVGKAKDLRKRVSSYFSKTLTSYKTHELVKRIHRIEFTIVDSEKDAFLLENNLIKEYQPKYNINLKDDKTYPYIVIKNEPFPRVFLTRQKLSDGSEYLGPYTSVKKVRELLEFIRQTIPLRTCSLALTASNISKGKFKVCLEYHLGNCKGPCEGRQTVADYDDSIQQLRHLLRGNLAPVLRYHREEMKRLAGELAFEKAALTRQKIDFLENYQARSVVANAKSGNVDVFTIQRGRDIRKQQDRAFVNFLMVRNGTIIQTHTISLETRLEESDEEVLGFAILHLRLTFGSDVSELVLPFRVRELPPELRQTVPAGGDKKKLLELSARNAAHFVEEMEQQARLQLGGETDTSALLEELQADLQLSQYPRHIECFDNSHFQGSYPVSAMVCFRDGKPDKSGYRRFNVKTVEGIDDFATMKEAVSRRYKRVRDEGEPFPQLVIIDGGKGQLGAALEAIEELGLGGHMTLIGLAKNEEELFFAGDEESRKLPLNSPSLKLIRRIRDEVHRFGITFHRQQRSKGTFTNELETIPGIGKSTAETLLKTFRSVKKVKEQSIDTLAELIGRSKAILIAKYFREQEEKKQAS